MYGSMGNEEDEKEIMPLMERKNSIMQQTDEQFVKNPFGVEKGKAFWKKVSDTYGDGKEMTWDEALYGETAEEIIQRVVAENKDPMVHLIESIHDKFMSKVKDPRLCTGFIQRLTKIGSIILSKDRDTAREENRDPRYSLVMQNHPLKITVLHLLAERNLVDLADIYLSKEFYPGHVHVDSQKAPKKLPLECSLAKCHDEISYLIAKRMRRSRVRMLFQYDEISNAKFKYSDIIQNPKMQSTVIAILDACMNPDWPFVPTAKGENVEMAWSRLQDKPIQYHFDYRLLDDDQDSEQPIANGVQNEGFKHLQPSCLQLIVESKHSDVAISHPVIRVLVDRKWNLYGKQQIWQWFFIYMLFLVCLGLALFLDDTITPRKYQTTKEKARGVFEVITVIFSFGYFIEEIDQLMKERGQYFTDVYNGFDLFGVLLIFIIIPLRFTDHFEAENGVASAAFLINCLRIFKFFPAVQDLGLYSKTFAEIVRVDIFKFTQLFIVIMFGFTGCIFLAMKAAFFPERKLGFWAILLKEARGLAEGNPFDDSYDAFPVVIIILIILNMGAIIVVLSNILIGQLSSRYTTAQEDAKIQFSIDKAKFITKIEKSRFRCMNLRMKHYTEGDFVSDEAYITELLTDWAKLTEKRSKASKEAIRNLWENIERQNYKKV